MNLRIVADSGCDYRELSDVDFKTVPLKIITPEQEYVDDANLDIEAMHQKIAESKSTSSTSCPNMFEWLEAFKGATEVIALTITSALSGSFSSAQQAKDAYQQENPEAKVHVCDTQLTSAGISVLLDYLKQLVKDNVPYEEIVEKLESYKKRCKLIFGLSSLDNMANNGRVPSLIAKGIGLLNIRIICEALEGKVKPIWQCRGPKKEKQHLVNGMIDRGYQGGPVHIHHVFDLAGAQEIAQMLKERFPNCQPIIQACQGMNSYYAEPGAILIGYEGAE